MLLSIAIKSSSCLAVLPSRSARAQRSSRSAPRPGGLVHGELRKREGRGLRRPGATRNHAAAAAGRVSVPGRCLRAPGTHARAAMGSTGGVRKRADLLGPGSHRRRCERIGDPSVARRCRSCWCARVHMRADTSRQSRRLIVSARVQITLVRARHLRRLRARRLAERHAWQ
jgi:hypothetical protein